MSCAFRDCGDPHCRVCWWGRQPQPHQHALSTDPLRDDAPAELRQKVRTDPTRQKRHRDGAWRGWNRKDGARI